MRQWWQHYLHVLFKNWANPGLFSNVYFHLFQTIQIKYKLNKDKMVCLGLEPRAAGWRGQTNPLSYGGTPIHVLLG